MKWSFRIGSLAGIGIYVHATFALILIWVGAIYYTQTGDPMQTASPSSSSCSAASCSMSWGTP